MSITIHQDDLPANFKAGPIVAIDSETTGLNLTRDRLCLVQLSTGDGHAHLIQFKDQNYAAPNLKALLTDQAITKIFHYGRFDIGIFQQALGVMTTNVYCTKIASKLVRTYTDRHGLKDLCRELLGVELSKQQQSTDWAAANLTPEQQEYAANDVLHLHQLKDKLDDMLARENRTTLAQSCFDFLPTRVSLDLEGWVDQDIFAHS